MLIDDQDRILRVIRVLKNPVFLRNSCADLSIIIVQKVRGSLSGG
jgi:hypothetical protein